MGILLLICFSRCHDTRIIQLLVRRVTVTAEGLVIDLRTDGIAGVMREMMTPRQPEAAE